MPGLRVVLPELPMTSPRSPSWPVAKKCWETQCVPLAPHPGTLDVSIRSAFAGQWKTRAHEGDLGSVTHIPRPQLPPLSQPHRITGGYMITGLAVFWEKKTKQQNPAQMQGVGAWAWECVDLWATCSILESIFKINPRCHLFPCYWLAALSSDAPEWLQVMEGVSLSYSEGCR